MKRFSRIVLGLLLLAIGFYWLMPSKKSPTPLTNPPAERGDSSNTQGAGGSGSSNSSPAPGGASNDEPRPGFLGRLFQKVKTLFKGGPSAGGFWSRLKGIFSFENDSRGEGNPASLQGQPSGPDVSEQQALQDQIKQNLEMTLEQNRLLLQILQNERAARENLQNTLQTQKTLREAQEALKNAPKK